MKDSLIKSLRHSPDLPYSNIHPRKILINAYEACTRPNHVIMHTHGGHMRFEHSGMIKYSEY